MHRVRRALQTDDVVELANGTRITSLARTAIDLAASRSLLGGIAAVSYALQQGVDHALLADGLRRLGPVTGVARARSALSRSSSGSESALETLVVVRCQDYGFELPEQQRVVTGLDGRSYRVDFAWRGGQVLGEADGRSKYADPALRDGRSAEEVVWAEKRREDALRPTCRSFIRFGWSDAWAGDALARRLESAGVPRQRRRLAALTF